MPFNIHRRAASIAALLVAGWLSSQSWGQPARPPANRDDAPLMAIAAIVEARSEHMAGPVTVRGTVTYAGAFVTLQDQTGAINIVTTKTTVLTLGDEAEAVGTDLFDNDAHTIVHAQISSLWRGAAPPPLAITPDDAADGAHNRYLVQVQGRLIRVDHEDGLTRLQMEGEHQFFSAQLKNTASQEGALGSLRPKSIVQFTGVLSVQHEQYSTSSGSFRIFLRSPADVSLISGPPWGSMDHIFELIVGLIALAILIQVAHVRNVERQFAAILGERARIARDIHDTLAQGFAGIALQLEVVRSSMSGDPSLADQHLRTAVGMVRHSRAEAHRSISTLRAFAHPMPLQDMLCEMVTSLSETSATVFHLDVMPLQHTLPQDSAEQLFRICQEAVSNCLQHAHAHNVWVKLIETEECLELSVQDNGIGFDAGLLDHAPMFHFGLVGMKERAARIKGRLKITSQPSGTTIQIRIPVATRKTTLIRRVARLFQRQAALSDKREGART